MSEAPKKRWYVVQAFSGFEGRVATSLREHIKLHNMEDLFGEVMVPTEEVVEIRGGQRRKSERKFFPGYVLVQMVMNDAKLAPGAQRTACDGLHRRYFRSSCANQR